jgi:hypothetical protein
MDLSFTPRGSYLILEQTSQQQQFEVLVNERLKTETCQPGPVGEHGPEPNDTPNYDYDKFVKSFSIFFFLYINT